MFKIQNKKKYVRYPSYKLLVPFAVLGEILTSFDVFGHKIPTGFLNFIKQKKII
jgi:hypothetical protein